MRVNRSPGAARNPDPATTGRLPGLRLGSGAVRVMSVTALATATCALWAIPASAAPVAHAAPSARHSAAQAAHRAAKKHSSKIAVSATPATAYADASVSLSATVKSSGKTPKGTVTFRVVVVVYRSTVTAYFPEDLACVESPEYVPLTE